MIVAIPTCGKGGVISISGATGGNNEVVAQVDESNGQAMDVDLKSRTD